MNGVQKKYSTQNTIFKFTMDNVFQRLTTVPYGYEDRQWDCRFNVQTQDYLDTIIAAIKSEDERGKFKYILIGGVEIGTKPSQDDYQVEHIHVASIFFLSFSFSDTNSSPS